MEDSYRPIIEGKMSFMYIGTMSGQPCCHLFLARRPASLADILERHVNEERIVLIHKHQEVGLTG